MPAGNNSGGRSAASGGVTGAIDRVSRGVGTNRDLSLLQDYGTNPTSEPGLARAARSALRQNPNPSERARRMQQGRGSVTAKGAFVKTDTGLRGLVVGRGTLGTSRNPIPAVKLDIGGGRTAVIPVSSLTRIG